MKYYKQSTIFTGAAAGLMNILYFFNKSVDLCRKTEFDIWSESAALPTRGCSLYGLAIYAKKLGVNVSLIVEDPDYKFPGYRFKSYKKKEVDIATFHSTLMLEKAKSLNIDIKTQDFTIDNIKTLLSEKKLLMVRLIIGVLRDTKVNKRNPHYIPVIGFSNGEFSIVDPKRGFLKISENKFLEAFEAVHSCRRDNRMLILG